MIQPFELLFVKRFMFRQTVRSYQAMSEPFLVGFEEFRVRVSKEPNGGEERKEEKERKW